MQDYIEEEIVEVQVWLMWILDLALFETGHHTLGVFLLVYSLVTLLLLVVKVIKKLN